MRGLRELNLVARRTPLEEALFTGDKVIVESETLNALRSDYDTLRRFVVSLAETGHSGAINALQSCSVTYLPPGHPDRSH